MPFLSRSQEFDTLGSSRLKFSVDRDAFQFMVKQGFPELNASLRNCRIISSDLEVDLVFEDSNLKNAAEEAIKKYLGITAARRMEEILLSKHANLFEIDNAVAQFALAHTPLHIRRKESTQSVIVMGQEMNFVKFAKQQLVKELPTKSYLLNTFKIEHFKFYYLIEHLRLSVDMYWPLSVYSVNVTSIAEWVEIEVTSRSKTNDEIDASIENFKNSTEQLFQDVYIKRLHVSGSIPTASWFPFLAPVLKDVKVYVRWAPKVSPKMYLMGTNWDDVQLIEEYCTFLMDQMTGEHPHRNDDIIGFYGEKVVVCLAMDNISTFHCDAIFIPFCQYPSSRVCVSSIVENAGGCTYQRLVASAKVDGCGDVVSLPALGKLQCKRVYYLREPDWTSCVNPEYLLQTLHDVIYPALANCKKHNYKQIAIAPIVSNSVTNSTPLFAKAFANAIETFLRLDIGQVTITIVSPKFPGAYAIARYMNDDLPASVLQPAPVAKCETTNDTLSRNQKDQSASTAFTTTEKLPRKRQALASNLLSCKKCPVVDTRSAAVQSATQVQPSTTSSGVKNSMTPKLDELQFIPDDRCQQEWSAVKKSGQVEVTMKPKSGHFCSRNGNIKIRAENTELVVDFRDTKTAREVVSKLKILFTNDKLFRYAYDHTGRLKARPVIRIPKLNVFIASCSGGPAGENEMKHFLHKLKSLLPWDSTSDQDSSPTSDDNLSWTSKQDSPSTSKQDAPSTSKWDSSTASQTTPAEASTNIKQGNEENEEEKCPICLACFDGDDDLKILQCKHTFHTACIDQALKFSKLCPMCKTPIVKLQGPQPPNGTMTSHASRRALPGHPDCGSIEIRYDIPSGVQSEVHANPGVPFSGTSRVAYLPDNTAGRRVLQLLRKAFEARLIFTVGRSLTTGMDNQVTWNDIHHKTTTSPGSTYGYPDPTYLTRVTADLHAMGIN